MNPMINDNNLEWFQILSSCNGLLPVSHYTDLYLWNPLTRQCTIVLSLLNSGYGTGYMLLGMDFLVARDFVMISLVMITRQ